MSEQWELPIAPAVASATFAAIHRIIEDASQGKPPQLPFALGDLRTLSPNQISVVCDAIDLKLEWYDEQMKSPNITDEIKIWARQEYRDLRIAQSIISGYS